MKSKSIMFGLICSIGVTMSQNVQADAASITFSKFRIVLDKNTKGEQLTLINNNNKNAECELDLNHYNFTETNELQVQNSAKTTYMPANKLLRYSPRSVTIPGRGTQKVKIGFRRRANLKPGEYISFFRIGCHEKAENLVLGQPNIGAQINYNLPVHVRVGDVKANSKIEFTELKALGDKYQLKLRQYRSGNRSLVGTLKVIDVDSGDVVGIARNFGLYRPAKYADHKFMLNEKPTSTLRIEFKESEGIASKVAQSLDIPSSVF